jgi:predicted phage terminase large subunit-like protein
MRRYGQREAPPPIDPSIASQRMRRIERALMADGCRASFWMFLNEAMGLRHHPSLKFWISEDVHRPLCNWLEAHGRLWIQDRKQGIREQRKLMVLLPRNFGKTTIITRAWLLWLHVQDPDISTFVGSENLSRAGSFVDPLRAILDGSDPYARFSAFYGSWFHRDRAWSATKVVHNARRAVARQDASIGIWGVETGLTGAHPDLLILDDPTSYEKLAAITNWLQYVNDHIDSLNPVLNADGMLVFVGTRYHDGDHFGRGLRTQGAASIHCHPGTHVPGVEPTADGPWHVYFAAVRDRDGKPTFPAVWSERRLKAWAKSNNMHYWAQGMNDPASGENNPLTRERIEKLLVDKTETPKNLWVSIHTDTAFFHQARIIRGDETVYQVWGHAKDGSGEVYFLEGYGSRTWKVDEFLTQLVECIRRLRISGYRVSAITDEREIGGKTGTYELLMSQAFRMSGVRMPRFVQIARGPTKKLNRLHEAAAYYKEGYVHLVRGAPGLERLIDQMSRIGTSDHDDWADAASDVFNPEVYIPARTRDQERQPPFPLRSGDAVLRPTYYSEAVRLYDAYYSDDNRDREPVQ